MSERSPSHIDRVVEAGGLVPGQVIAMNICKQRSVDKRVYCGTHCDILQLPQQDFFFSVGGQVIRAEGAYEGREG